MDFGDILNQWDSIQKSGAASPKNNSSSSKKQVQKKTVSSPQKDSLPETEGKQINPMELWLRRYGTVDKDEEIDRIERKKQNTDREYLKSLKPQAVIDLHGLTRDEAWQRLDAFTGDCVRRGLKKVLIIHGKGIHSNGSDPVLGDMVRKFIETDKRLGSSGHSDRTHGGSGSTWVILRS